MERSRGVTTTDYYSYLLICIYTSFQIACNNSVFEGIKIECQRYEYGTKIYSSSVYTSAIFGAAVSSVSLTGGSSVSMNDSFSSSDKSSCS